MSVDKFGRYVHPYYRHKKVKTETVDLERVGVPKEQFYEFTVVLYGCETDTYTDYTYNGKSGQITGVSGNAINDSFTINQGELQDGVSLLGKDIKFGDVFSVFHSETKPEITIKVYQNDKKSARYKFKQSHKLYRRVYKFLLQSGKIVQADVTPATFVIKDKTYSTLKNLDLKYGDIITFYPKIKYFEANLVIKCPIPNNGN